MSHSRPALWIPGPTEVRQEILDVLAEPMIGHRTPELEDAIDALDPFLRELFGAPDGETHVAIHSCTATGLMELGLRSVGPRVLALVNGAFSRRFAEVAEALGKEVTRLESPLGSPADVGAARLRLASGERFDAITVCASETSTGALTSPAEIGSSLQTRAGARLLVDVVTLLGAGPVDVAACGIDFAFAGTQKALALPPGLGLFAVSADMLAGALERPSGSYFLDLVRIVTTHADRKPPMTPTIPLIRALLRQLQDIGKGHLEREWIVPSADVNVPKDGLGGGQDGGLTQTPPLGASGLDIRFERHRRMRALTRSFAQRSGLEIFGAGSSVEATSPTVSCLAVEEPARVLSGLADRGFQIGGGYGALKGSCVRIGHMGDHSLSALQALLAELDGVLAEGR